MNRSELYKKSLELLDQYISETPKSEITELITKHRKSNIQGPNYTEYLESVQVAFESVNWHSVAHSIAALDISSCNAYQLTDKNGYYVPPPSILRKNILNNQDSTIIVESFFLV